MCQTGPVRALACTLVAVLLVASGCGGEDPEDWPPERPRIDAVRFVGQSPRDPLGLQFLLEFVDADGDLGAGTLRLTIDGQEAGRIALEELFAGQTPALEPSATFGELEVLVRLAEEPASGDALEVGFTLEDAEGHRSNTPSMTMATR